MTEDDPPSIPSPAASVLRDMLASHGWPQTLLALRADISPKHLNRILRSAALFSPEVALRFERVLGVPAETLMALQAKWQVDIAREQAATAAAEREDSNDHDR